ncbi:MAG: amino acid dehydrogenase [Deltaproteobacteria bacterium]|nr:MAG: amino acid dehydrogenase [Deltaproteobacteria bacterium]
MSRPMQSGPPSMGARSVHRRWLKAQMNPYFFVAMRDEPEALAILERELGTLRFNRRLLLADRPTALILATASLPGSLYETLTLHNVAEREISYAMFAHSDDAMPGLAQTLEIQRFEFDRKNEADISANYDVEVPVAVRRRVARAIRAHFPGFDQRKFDPLLNILWLNNENYVRISPPRRVAQTLHMFREAQRRGGLYLAIEPVPEQSAETRISFAVGNPPQHDFLRQVMEIFHRLQLGVNRAYCLTISSGIHPYFLASFYVHHRGGGSLAPGSELYKELTDELCNTQLLATDTFAYREFVRPGLMSGAEASLVNAFIAFCHTSLAHSQPDRYDLEEVRSAFHANPQIALLLVELFRCRFAPGRHERDAACAAALAAAEEAVAGYNTGRRHLDDLRRQIFRCALILIRRTLKTNAFVAEKQALAFRLDPACLAELGAEFTADLPAATPFRITFFFSRVGFGYHVGFSDIARGGWRTVIARSHDDLVTSATTLFRETFVLAHTQHAKNKDIFEGGSKMVVLLDATDIRRNGDRADEQAQETVRLYRLQYGIASAFLDIFVTAGGVASHPAVVDYYREEEAIELGPDENMHDVMIEAIARLARRRGYLLGAGIMSSKQVGINHKEYGVTSTGVVTFAEHVMAEFGMDLRRDPVRIKMTGGPNGDVAGNAIRLLLGRAPQARFVLILDGTAALADPAGADRDELRRLVLKNDLDAFDPQALHVGGVLLYRSGSRWEGLRKLYRRVCMTADGLREEWVSGDDFAREYGELVFAVPADLFIPAGGRPETIDRDNWKTFLLPDGTPSARAVVEGANSFLTPEARIELQRAGVLIMRDASANKCGVISSSYEIIANLLLADEEFLACKERYVRDVLAILEKRAADEARLILRRHRERPERLCTEISDAISGEINAHYARLFLYFLENPGLPLRQPYRRALLAHLPALLREEPRFRRRLGRLPQKYRAAILAAEIGSSLVYRGDREADLADAVRLHVQRYF